MMTKPYNSPDRNEGRYGKWVDDNYDTNYWNFRHLWYPKNNFSLWDITHGSDAYDEHTYRYMVRRLVPWEGSSSFFALFTYPAEIKKAYNKKKKKEIKSVYKPLGRG